MEIREYGHYKGVGWAQSTEARRNEFVILEMLIELIIVLS